jgi:hypothetical protein
LPKSTISLLTILNHRINHFKPKTQKDQNHENSNFG